MFVDCFTVQERFVSVVIVYSILEGSANVTIQNEICRR